MERESPEMLAGKSLGKPDPLGVGTGWDMELSELAEPQSPLLLCTQGSWKGDGTTGREQPSREGKRGSYQSRDLTSWERESHLFRATVWRAVVMG